MGAVYCREQQSIPNVANDAFDTKDKTAHSVWRIKRWLEAGVSPSKSPDDIRLLQERLEEELRCAPKSKITRMIRSFCL